MPDFEYINCPQCKFKFKLDRGRQYHDCPECGFEFRLDQVDTPALSARPRAEESLLNKLARIRADESLPAG